MKLYTRTNASTVQHADHGEFTVADDGSVEVPDTFGEILHRIFIAGKQAWETEVERFHRLTAERNAHDEDPKSLLAELRGLRDDLVGARDALPVLTGEVAPADTGEGGTDGSEAPGDTPADPGSGDAPDTGDAPADPPADTEKPAKATKAKAAAK